MLHPASCSDSFRVIQRDLPPFRPCLAGDASVRPIPADVRSFLLPTKLASCVFSPVSSHSDCLRGLLPRSQSSACSRRLTRSLRVRLSWRVLVLEVYEGILKGRVVATRGHLFSRFNRVSSQLFLMVCVLG